MSGVPRAVLVTVGDELLLGKTVDTNGAWLAAELSTLGVEVVRTLTVGDVGAHIREGVRTGMDEADLVVVTGGLGPTSDDVTRPAVAGLLDAPLRVDEGLLESLRARFRRRGLPDMPETNRSQAEVPLGARVLRNAHGTAPGLVLERRGRLVALLPGVPREMRSMARDGLWPLLTETFGSRLRPVRHRVLHTTGIPESELAVRMEGLLPPPTDAVSVAFLPDLRGVDVRLTARGLGKEEAHRRLDALEASLDTVLAPFRYRAPGGDLVEAVTEALRARGRRLAVAESCTGGLVTKRMTDLAGSSAVLEGGVVAYANAVKEALLDVPTEVLEAEGAVSEPVARAMASGVRRRFGTDVGVGVTGIAGPEGGTEDKPVGLVWLAVDVEGRVRSEQAVFPGDRSAVRERAAQAALALLLDALREGA